MKRHSLAQFLLATALAASSVVAHAEGGVPFPGGLFIFGDSLSDTGNNLTAFGGVTGPNPSSPTFVPTLPYSSGVYSNGPVWVNSFAAGLGLPGAATPSLLGGSNYAYGGAKMATVSGFPPSLQTQLNTFLGGHTVSPDALYVVAGGGNDVRQAASDVKANPSNAKQIVANASAAFATSVSQMVGALNAAGAQHIVVWNVPDLGRTPSALDGSAAAPFVQSFISKAFNTALTGAIAGQTDVTLFDTFGLITSIANTGSAFGHTFTNTTKACGFAGNGCDPATALFWDGIHPTAYAHEVLGLAMLAAVPEPSVTWLFMAGLVSLAVWRRRAA
jgi:outer membrane lipase/esterase